MQHTNKSNPILVLSSQKTNNECSVGGFINEFKKLKSMTDIPHTISTGNKFVDKNIATYGAKALDVVVKDPRGKMVVKGAKTVYPYVETGSANIARIKTAYKNVCSKKK